MFSRIKRALLKLGRVKRKVFCLFTRHQWRYYHRRRRLPVLVSRETHYGIFPRRVCVHCGKRETVIELPRGTPTHPRGLGIDRVPFEAVSNESGALSLPADAPGEGKAGRVETDPVC